MKKSIVPTINVKTKSVKTKKKLVKTVKAPVHPKKKQSKEVEKITIDPVKDSFLLVRIENDSMSLSISNMNANDITFAVSNIVESVLQKNKAKSKTND